MNMKCNTCGPLEDCNCTVSYVEYLKLIDLLARLQPWIDYPTPSELVDEVARTVSEADVPWPPAERD
jgi:hypothetical protein